MESGEEKTGMLIHSVFSEKEASGSGALSDSQEKPNFKGKDVVSEEDRWVERDFLSLNEIKPKREVEEDVYRDCKEKKPKLETLSLSLALPGSSLSFPALPPNNNPNSNSNPNPNPNPIHHPTSSHDFTAASVSYSYSLPFSHNPSCSLTRNSTENYDCWHTAGGDGTNGSVHSRFKPIGEASAAVSLLRQHSNGHSFLPSELPARQRQETISMDSRGRNSGHRRELESCFSRQKKTSRPERVLLEIVTESVGYMAHVFGEMMEDEIEATKEYLRCLMAASERRDEFSALQGRLDRRSDLTSETLAKANRDQLDIMVAIRTGLCGLLTEGGRVTTMEMVEIFLYTRCKNVNCRSMLPVDDCDCKICSSNKGFCRECMCPVCLISDCANNTCTWVGCDVCSHWYHAACGIRKNLIRPGPSLKGPSGTSEMQVHCIGCGHASQMFGFVKDVFLLCSKEWDAETMGKELDCVRKIFRGSPDYRGKELQIKVEDMLTKLENKDISLPDVCISITQFFHDIERVPELPGVRVLHSQARSETTILPQPSAVPPPKYGTYGRSGSSSRIDMIPRENNNNHHHHQHHQSTEEETGAGKEGFEGLEGVVRVKEMEAMMFQNRADEARREAESYRRMVKSSNERLEEEYTQRLARLCLQETQDRRRVKFEELNGLETSRCNYFNMKLRMQGEIAALLERMEAAKQLPISPF